MATKTNETVNLIDSFAEFKETKNIDRATLVSVLEECFRSVISKIYGSDENYDVIVNPDKGDFEIYRNRTVVPDGEVKDSNMEISLSEARAVEDDYEVGEEVSQLVKFSDFGRRAILTLRQTLASRILELEHDTLYNQYKERIGEVVTAEVYQTWKRETLLMDDENNELILPRTEQIRGDFSRINLPLHRAHIREPVFVFLRAHRFANARINLVRDFFALLLKRGRDALNGVFLAVDFKTGFAVCEVGSAEILVIIRISEIQPPAALARAQNPAAFDYRVNLKVNNRLQTARHINFLGVVFHFPANDVVARKLRGQPRFHLRERVHRDLVGNFAVIADVRVVVGVVKIRENVPHDVL